jgi:hypothetical protein
MGYPCPTLGIEHVSPHHMSDQVVTSAALSCLGEYSHANNLAKRVVGLYLYATGAQRQTIHVLSTFGLSESYSNLITQNVYRKRRSATRKRASTSDSEQPVAADAASDAASSEQVRRTGTLHQLSGSLRERENSRDCRNWTLWSCI